LELWILKSTFHLFHRSAEYGENGTRTLTENYGLKILIEVEGKGKKFSFLSFLYHIGAMYGTLSIVSLSYRIFILLFTRVQI